MLDMAGGGLGGGSAALADLAGVRGAGRARWGYRLGKRGFDLAVSALLVMPLALAALVLLMLNPWFNRGPLLFVQERMGQHCRPFRAYKFRSMTGTPAIARGAFDALDAHRITPLGRLLRRSRLDELPQVINVLKGEMSLIGPRPDYHPHAQVYLAAVPGYRERHAAKPGISGLAQTEVGYVDGPDGVRAKVDADLRYLHTASLRLDLWIAWRTLAVIAGQKGC